MSEMPSARGPILFARDLGSDPVRVGAVVLRPEDDDPPAVEVPGGHAEAPARLYARLGLVAWGVEMALPARTDAEYRVDGRSYPVMCDLAGDHVVGFVSCNGQEEGDRGRDLAERNAMWARLATRHRERPLGLLLQGGDQLYSDEMLTAHPEIARWSEAEVEDCPGIAMTDEMEAAAEDWLFRRYCEIWGADGVADLVATVPSFMIWDDHDIFDGWGSHPEALQTSPVARGVFRVATRMFRLFQRGEAPSADVPDIGFSACLPCPGFAVMAPDLRAGRTKTRVMPPATWTWIEKTFDALPPQMPVFLVSTVPLLGPRLSWIEAVMDAWPGRHQYEDDLRDQWQSRIHRSEWRRILGIVEREVEDKDRPVTALSGEIHLAMRAEMRLRSGRIVHQLTSSGISHPEPPAAWARTLGLLARFGENPLTGRPISIHPLPGRRWHYERERNFLILERRDGHWRTMWETEQKGPTDWMDLPMGDHQDARASLPAAAAAE